MKPKKDLCNTCLDLRENIAGAFDEETKLKLTQRLIYHIDKAKQEREFYKNCTRTKEELMVDICCRILHHMKMSIIRLIFHILRSKLDRSFFFNSERSDIRSDDIFPLQTNNLIDENETIGENVSKCMDQIEYATS